MAEQNNSKNRIQATTHLRAVIMHFEAALVIDSESWEYDDIIDCRTGRDLARKLIAKLDT